MKKYETFEEVCKRLIKEQLNKDISIEEIEKHNFNNTHEALDYYKENR